MRHSAFQNQDHQPLVCSINELYPQLRHKIKKNSHHIDGTLMLSSTGTYEEKFFDWL